MGDASNVPELQHNGGTGDMDCLGHAFPTFDLLSAVNSGSRNVALTFRCDLRRFHYYEAGARALSIIESVQLSRHVAGSGPAAGQGGHDNAVLNLERTHLGGTKKVRRLTHFTLLHGYFSEEEDFFPCPAREA